MNFNVSDYRLFWPWEVFEAEIVRLVEMTSSLFRRDTEFEKAQRNKEEWMWRCERILTSSLVDQALKPPPHISSSDVFGFARPGAAGAKKFLHNLLRQVSLLQEEEFKRKPYWSERQSASSLGRLSLGRAIRECIKVINDLHRQSFFSTDNGPSIEISLIIEEAIGVSVEWASAAHYLEENKDVFYDILEILHDQAVYSRIYKGYGRSDFSTEIGQRVYRWRINQVLKISDLELHFADEGEDVGRLVVSTDPAREDLAGSVIDHSGIHNSDVVSHAIALFRSRDANEHMKRSAVIALAAVLEARRTLLKTELISKDEAALFHIANQFAIRHQNDAQKPNYDPIFLDWIFWWYLATIELTNRIIARQQ